MPVARRLLPHVVAVFGVAAALLLQFALGRRLPDPAAIYVVAVVLASSYGVGPGLVALVLGAGARVVLGAPAPASMELQIVAGAVAAAVVEFFRRRRASLRATVEELGEIIDALPVGFSFVDGDLRYVHVNQALAAITGRPPSHHIGRTIREVNPGLAPAVEQSYRRVLETGEPDVNVELSAEMPRTPGDVRHWLVSHRPIRNRRGAVIGVGTAVIDMTEQHRAQATREGVEAEREAALAREGTARADADEANRELDDIFANGPIAIHWAGPDGIIQRANRTELALLGYPAEEYVGRHFGDFHADRAVADDLLARLARGETLNDFPARLRSRDGTIKHVLIDSNVLWRNGQFIHTRSYTRDVTAQKQADAERAELLAIAERARGDAETAAGMSSRLQSITDAALANLDLHGLLPELLERITAALGVDRTVILLLEPDEPMLVMAAASKGFEDEVESPVRIPVGKGFAGRIAVERRPMIVEDIQKSDVVNPLLRPKGIRSLLGVPLLVEGRMLGVIDVGSRQPRRFQQDDVTLLRLVADRVALAIDRTRIHEAEQQARLAAESADRTKEEFLAMLAHELRNPLAPLSNALHLLTREPQHARERSLEIGLRQVKHLGRLVDDLLDVARITRGRIELKRRSLELRAVVAAAVQSTRPAIDAREQQLSVTLPAEPIHLHADEVRIEQILGNLLTNAAKYGSAGGHIWLTVERAGNNAAIRVRDDGIGIAPEILPRVFDLFAQADRSLVRDGGGLGIGLTVVRRLVEMHGGTVEARSEGLGRGSEFMITLPILDSPGAVRQAAPPTVPVAEQTLRILVVDDNRDSAESLAMLLELGGHEVRTSYDGVAALDAIAADRPDAVLLDIGLPGLDGYEVARRVRAMPGAAAVLLVAVSGYGGEDDRERSRDAGFDHHLVKPVDLAALERLLVRADGAAGRPGTGSPTIH